MEFSIYLFIFGAVLAFIGVLRGCEPLWPVWAGLLCAVASIWYWFARLAEVLNG